MSPTQVINMNSKYPLAIRLLHWAMALIIFGMAGTGWYMADLPDDAVNKYDLYPLHKSFGVMILILVSVRLVVRLKSVLPALPQALANWEISLSHVAHKGMYVFMIAAPLSGYLMASAYELSHGVDFFGMVLPDLWPKSNAASGFFHEVHELNVNVLLGIVILHVAGVLKHRFFDKNKEADVLGRII
jgi:cytochrome b561